jgi:hypothetical protein
VTTAAEVAASKASLMSSFDEPPDHRGSWIPTGRMITTRIKELRKRRGLMIAVIVVNIGIPTVFLVVRLLAHAFDPKSYGPAGGYDIYTGLVAGVMYVFGFIIAATVGCTAGSADLTEGMFRHQVVTGRSRLALYLARIPAGLAIITSMVAVGFAIVCIVCVLAAPTALSFNNVNVPVGLSSADFQTWASQHADQVICNFPYNGQITANVPCGNGPGGNGAVTVSPSGGSGVPVMATPAQASAQAVVIARWNYSDYASQFLYPTDSLMVKSGLWIELEAVIGFIVGLGLASLLGQRTVAVILMIVLEIVLTPIFSRVHIPHLINFQRSLVGLATAHLEPGALPLVFGNGGGGPGGPHQASLLVSESTTVAICVVIAWLIGWTAIGAWRMITRDA